MNALRLPTLPTLPVLPTLSILAALLVLTACDKAPEPAPASAPVSASADAGVKPEWPQAQIDFLALSADVKSAQSNASSDAERDKLREEAPATFCAGFEKVAGFKDWIGTVDDIRTSTVNKSIDFEVDIGGNIKLEEILQTGDALYPTVAALHVGDTVRISGVFVHSKTGAECIYYMGPFGAQMTQIAKI